jgi:predicted Zn finger-like uncharacterized protein
MPEASAEKVVAQCPCGAQFRVPAAAVGRKVRCSKCNEVFRVEDAARRAPQLEADEQDMFAGMAALANLEKKAAADPTQAPVGKRMCPQCGGSIGATAALCTNCGYNLATGQTLKGATAKSVKMRSLAVGAGTFAIGSALSGLAALLGGFIWFLIAYNTGYEIGWIAWGVGLLAAGGMLLGYRKRNARAGVVAAGMSALGIVAAKVMVFAFVIYVVVTGDTNNVDAQRAFLAARKTDEALNRRELYDPDKRMAAWDGAFEKEMASLQKLSDDDVRAEWEKYRQEEARLNAFATEDGRKQAQVARHQTERRVRAEGVPLFGDRQQEIYKEEFGRALELTAEALGAETARIEAWENGEKWNDPEFVRSELIYTKLEERIGAAQEADEDYDYPEGDQWKQLYTEAVAEVDAVPVDERLALIKASEVGAEDEGAREELASHHTALLTRREGMSSDDPLAEKIYEKQVERFAAMRHDELVAETTKMEAWNAGGMWDDPAATRDELIYAYADQAIDERRARRRALGDEEFWTPGADEWQVIYAEASTKADAIPPEQRAETAKRLDDEAAAKWRAKWEEEEAAELREDTSNVVAGFFTTMFGPLDLLFFGLAIWTAFGIASGRQSE